MGKLLLISIGTGSRFNSDMLTGLRIPEGVDLKRHCYNPLYPRGKHKTTVDLVAGKEEVSDSARFSKFQTQRTSNQNQPTLKSPV